MKVLEYVNKEIDEIMDFLRMDLGKEATKYLRSQLKYYFSIRNDILRKKNEALDRQRSGRDF
jgi:hypothetical protein